MPYHVGEKGSYGCSGYPAVKDDGTVMGCHKTREEAAAQIYAINQSEGNIEDKTIKEPDAWPEVSKAEESYSPNSGMKAAARRALKWKEEGKATGAGTPVGWGRATDIVAGRSMSLSVVRRMYSFFSRHEVDKKGKDFYNTSNPSNGRIMWDAWGGDAGFSWSRAIVRRNEDKALFADFGKDYTKTQSLSSVFKSDDMDEDEMMPNKATSVRVGQMVSWNSSGGKASGKVKRIITSGSYKVPGTSVTINGSQEDPAVVIELESGQIVAHRRSTLRAS